MTKPITFDLYPLTVYAYEISSEKDLDLIEQNHNFSIKEETKEDMKFSKGYCIKPEHNVIVILIFKERIKDNIERLKCIRHEVQNAAFYIFDWIHAPDSDFKGMAFNYLNDYIFENVLYNLYGKISMK